MGYRYRRQPKKPPAIDENYYNPKPVLFSGNDFDDDLKILVNNAKYEAASRIYRNIRYTLGEIARNTTDKRSLEIVCEQFENLLSKQLIEDIVAPYKE